METHALKLNLVFIAATLVSCQFFFTVSRPRDGRICLTAGSQVWWWMIGFRCGRGDSSLLRVILGYQGSAGCFPDYYHNLIRRATSVGDHFIGGCRPVLKYIQLRVRMYYKRNCGSKSVIASGYLNTARWSVPVRNKIDHLHCRNLSQVADARLLRPTGDHRLLFWAQFSAHQSSTSLSYFRNTTPRFYNNYTRKF